MLIPLDNVVPMVNAVLKKYANTAKKCLMLVTQCNVGLYIDNQNRFMFIITERDNTYLCMIKNSVPQVIKITETLPCDVHANDTTHPVICECFANVVASEVTDTHEHIQHAFNRFTHILHSAGFVVESMSPKTLVEICKRLQRIMVSKHVA